ncbi:DUF2523 domain-containing protein [Acinetobacter ursingii]|uniref:DUF2523 domain-containing protein n=1 Tax=Acinetobacter ursingii TaxID=108980 RepID=UPI0021CD5824|nr:DUF2523 domain-containing protein [Acinetobacter ursingii]MCU4496796.1 DUF2523 domain-containing protein [Acinetobacter ursingii]MCU4496804.1 DUF2523 domain-containing protein [Acinetobacter ursingii]
MWRILFLVGEFLLKQSIKTALLGAGLGLASTAGVLVALNIYISKLQSQANSMPSDTIALLAMSGFPIAFSMVIGAVVFRLTLNASVKLVKLK